MGSTSAPISKGFSGFSPNESLFGGPVIPQQQASPTKGPAVVGGQKTMPLPGAPRLPTNPFPEIARRRLRWNGF